ncbi:MAG: glycosyltransferase [Candidatus Omnitrophota bacterium]
MAKISTITLTYNEEADIERCLRSLQWVDETIVIDCFSSDKTVIKAKPLCTRIIQQNMTDFSALRNFGIQEAKNTWVLMVDADEIVPPELAKEIREAINIDAFNGYYLRRINYMYGKELCYDQPDYHLRLFRKEEASYLYKVHEVAVVTGKVCRLKNNFLHYSMKNINEHVQKMNTYTTLAAAQRHGANISLFIKPFYRFAQHFFLKRACRDGMLGLILSLKAFFYEFLVLFKIWERKVLSRTWPEFYENVNIEQEIIQQANVHKEFIKTLLSDRPRKFLEVGSGAASISFSILKQNRINLITVDNRLEILKSIVNNAQKLGLHIAVVCADAFRLPFKKDSVNVTFSQGLLEHFDDSDICKILDEQLRISDSSVVFSVPNNHYRRKDFGNERLLSKIQWEFLLKNYKLLESRNYYYLSTKRNFLFKLPLMYMCKLKKR